MQVFSEEWAVALKEKINLNLQYKKLSADWKFPLIFMMKEDAGVKSIFLDLYEGECKTTRIASQQDFEKAEYVMSASKETWRKILDKSLDTVSAITMRRLEVTKGNLFSLLKYVNSSKELIESAVLIETEF